MVEEVSNIDRSATDTDSITVEKNSRGYNWKLKICSLDLNKLDEMVASLERRFSASLM